MLNERALQKVEVIVVGASAGGIEALRCLLPELPAGLRQPVVVVLHVSSSLPSLLIASFAPRCLLPVKEPFDKQPVGRGIWFAPPGYHLLIEEGGTFAFSVDEPVQYSRPSVDVLFESTARAFGDKALGVVLTGANEDGGRGVASMIAAGAPVLAQTPSEAIMPMMPCAALDSGATAAPLDEIRRTLLRISEL